MVKEEKGRKAWGRKRSGGRFVRTGAIRIWAWMAAVIGVLAAAGCSVERTEPVKVEDLTYTILEESQIPQELAALIEEKKTQRFQLTFDTEGERYIVVGYGIQPTGGYSISVEELYLSTNAIYINTNLIGPMKGETVTEVESYPYLVVRIENRMDYSEKSVVFE